MKTILSNLFITIFVFLAACENKPIDLQFNPVKGLTYRQQYLIDVETVQGIEGREVTLQKTIEIITRNTVTDNQQGQINVECIYVYLKVSLDIDGEKSTYDSADTTKYASATNGGPLLRSVLQKPFKIVINSKGIIEQITGFEKQHPLLYDCFDIDRSVTGYLIKTFENDFGNNALKTYMQYFTAIFPCSAVSMGDSWQTETIISGSLNGVLNNNISFKKIKTNLADLECTAQITTTAGENVISWGGITQQTQLTGTQTGKITLNLEYGLPVAGEITQHLKGNIVLSQPGLPAPVNIPLQQTIKIQQTCYFEMSGLNDY